MMLCSFGTAGMRSRAVAREVRARVEDVRGRTPCAAAVGERRRDETSEVAGEVR